MSEHKLRLLIGALTAGVAMQIPVVHAAGWEDKVTVSGFASAVYRKTDDPNHFNGDGEEAGVTEDGSFQWTRMGLNINAQVSDKVTVASQFYSSRGEENYNTVIDWSFVSLNLSDEFTFRGGKIKFPAGLVNEHVDVGVTYPWIAPPTAIYAEEFDYTNATFESYSGFSALFETSTEDWTFGADIFMGNVPGETHSINKLTGVALTADWDDTVLIKASTHTGTVHETPLGELEDEKLTSTIFGIRANYANIIAYAEYAKVDMGDFDEGEAKAWYTTLGYEMGDFTPHVTYQKLEKNMDGGGGEEPKDNTITTVGLNYSLDASTTLKAEYSIIKNKGDGESLLEETAADEPADTVKMLGVAIDVVF